jgi:hypothetical protein
MGYSDWTTADVIRQLKALGFGQYSQDFQTNEICGLHLPFVTEDHLKEMGVKSIGHRILIQRRFADIVAGKVVTQSQPQKPVQKVVAVAEPPKRSESRAQAQKNSVSPAKTQNLPKCCDHSTQKAVGRGKSDASDSSSAYSSDRSGPKVIGREKQAPRVEPTESVKKVEKAGVNQNIDQDNKVPCPYCGRKFFADLAQRHMNVCGRYNSKMTKK